MEVHPHPNIAQISKVSKTSSEKQDKCKQVSILWGYRPQAPSPVDHSHGFLPSLLEAAVPFWKTTSIFATSLITLLAEWVLPPSHSCWGSMLKQGMQVSLNPCKGREQHHSAPNPAQGHHPHLLSANFLWEPSQPRQNSLHGKEQVSWPPLWCSKDPCLCTAANCRETFCMKVFLPFALSSVWTNDYYNQRFVSLFPLATGFFEILGEKKLNRDLGSETLPKFCTVPIITASDKALCMCTRYTLSWYSENGQHSRLDS